MSAGLSFEELMEYTEWERGKWREWFATRDNSVLEIKTGDNGDGRFNTIGDVIRHIFSAEARYVDKLRERPLTDTALIASTNAEGLFQFGQKSRAELREFVKSRSAQEWDTMLEFRMFGKVLRGTPRKIIGHVLTHEIRHWAQIATMLRLNGLKVDWQDFLFSPVLGGGVEQEPE